MELLIETPHCFLMYSSKTFPVLNLRFDIAIGEEVVASVQHIGREMMLGKLQRFHNGGSRWPPAGEVVAAGAGVTSGARSAHSRGRVLD